MTEKPKDKRKTDRWLMIALALATLFVFANSLTGEFVHDDKRQIVRNPLIQRSELYGKALLSDVWAFKGDGSTAMSNYWRPTFTAWSMINYQLFGLDPVGWHLTNILLHCAVVLIAFLLLRGLGASSLVSFGVGLLFSVHPVHSESVAWISGSPDILFSLSLLSSLWFAHRFRIGQNRVDLIFALFLYAVSLGAKEIALACVPLYWLILTDPEKRITGHANRKAVLPAFALFALVGVGYFIARWAVLGSVLAPSRGQATTSQTLLTVPSIVAFYLQQLIAPIYLGPNHSVRLVEDFTGIGLLIALFSLSAIVVLAFLARRSRFGLIGFGLLVLPILLALNAAAFPPEEIVHNRYLYLPVLGLLMIIVPPVADLIGEKAGDPRRKVFLLVVVALAALFGLRAVLYNRVWNDDLSLWSHAVEVDPSSSFAFSQLGAVHEEEKQYEQAIDAFDRSLAIKNSTRALLGRGRVKLAKGQAKEAIPDIERAIKTAESEPATKYAVYQSYEALAVALLDSGQNRRAKNSLEDARKKLPDMAAALTGKLAVVLYQNNQKREAMRELERYLPKARIEMLPESKTVLYRLGALYAEFGRTQEAREILREYLESTSNFQDEITINDRRAAREYLDKL